MRYVKKLNKSQYIQNYQYNKEAKNMLYIENKKNCKSKIDQSERNEGMSVT